MAPHPHCRVLAPTQKQPHRWPGDAPGAPGLLTGLAGPSPGPANPPNPISGENLQRGSPFLCALFFVLLKFSPPCRWPPPPAQPRKGAEAWGAGNPDPAKKLHRGDRPERGPSLFTLAGRDAFSGPDGRRSRGLRRRSKEPAPWTRPKAVGAGQIARGDNKKSSSIVFPFHSPGEGEKSSMAQAAGPHRETQGIWFELARAPLPRLTHTHARTHAHMHTRTRTQAHSQAHTRPHNRPHVHTGRLPHPPPWPPLLLRLHR